MLHHLLKLIWKRKTGNLLLSLEIMIAFAIVFAIAAYGARNLQLYLMPTGARYLDVWSVGAGSLDSHEKIDAAVYDGLRRALKELPEIEEVGFVSNTPFTGARRTRGFTRRPEGGDFSSDMIEASDDFFKVSDLHLIEGRWYSAADDGAAGTPVVINRLGAQAWFPGQSAVGKVISDGGEGEHGIRYLVTGVVEDYRSQGEFKVPEKMTFTRLNPGDGTASGGRMQTVLIKLRPGTPRIFEARLNEQLRRWRSNWWYSVTPLADARASLLRSELMPLAMVAVIAAFLLLMVGFGLFGVLWQNTTRRIPEIGLRRALGASGGAIYRQIIAEQLLLSTAAMALALLMLVQLPLTKAFGASLNWPVFLLAAALSMAVIYLISLLCSLYPGWRASRLSPTQALHYE